VGSIAVNNADIWGFASVGSSSSSAVSVGSNGTIATYDKPQGTIDTTRIATDFTANFDAEMSPTVGTVIASVGATLGTAATTATYRFSGQINSSLTINGNVTLILTGSGDVVKLTGVTR